jgi:N-acetylglutamate synthase-like GNAT family acetyltransferase
MTIDVVRKARLDDLDGIKQLADQQRSELGFVLRPAIKKSIERGEVFVVSRGNGIIGFVEYHHRRDEQTTLYHIAVSSRDRNNGIGKSLFAALEEEARRKGKRLIQLKCPETLPANGFYAHLGCKHQATENGNSRALVVWRKDLNVDQ